MIFYWNTQKNELISLPYERTVYQGFKLYERAICLRAGHGHYDAA
jgi:hypothetical protein